MNLVKRSLYLCIGALLAMLGLQGVLSVHQLARSSAATAEVVASSRLASDTHQVWSRFLEADKALRAATQFTDVAQAEARRKAFVDSSAELRRHVKAMLDSAAGSDKASSAALVGKVDAWQTLAARHMGTEEVTELPAYHLLEAAKEAVERDIETLVAHSGERAAATVAASDSLTRTSYVLTLGLLAGAVLAGVVLGWRALNSLHAQLGADATEVARVANAMADGDLMVHIPTGNVPSASVMAALTRMQQALQKTVSNVLGISATLARGSNEIASGNHDLSERTEQQASALVRTAATMEQLGTTVRQNAENSSQASRLADQASAVATRGGSVVGQAVDTMRGINDSSRKIADIIGVIDGIAFQTNILALNAAVEAARAGEQGRGFAVVASEVRNLAQRSAGAAREIKALITTSVERVEAGSALVDQAGRTMQEVVQSIERVTAVMAEIRTASAEQSAGVAQVGHSVAELDQATQRNASLAEQSASAAESLKAQGQQLVDAMTFFKLAPAH